MDVSAISAAITSLLAAKDIAHGMIGLRDDIAFREKLIEFQSKLLDANTAALQAQEERAALLRRVDELEAKLAVAENWESEKRRYELVDLGGGRYVYALRSEAANSEPPHSLCPTCFQQNRKSLMQDNQESKIPEHKAYCPACKTTIYLRGTRLPGGTR